jgi:hypothetical protein
VPVKRQAVRTVKARNGEYITETYTETVQEDCPTCDGSGTVVDFDG